MVNRKLTRIAASQVAATPLIPVTRCHILGRNHKAGRGPNKDSRSKEKNMKTILRRIVLASAALISVAAVSGCVVVPERGPYYGYGYGYHHYWER